MVLFAGAARAQPAAADRALATDLFDQARALSAEGKHAEACPKFAESQRLDPSGGTLLNLANCHEVEGKTATAWSEFREALAVAERERQPERVTFAQEHIDALARRLSRLVIRVPSSLAGKVLEVRRDGTAIPNLAIGSAMPIDPGSHHIEVRGDGYKPWSADVEIVDGALQDVEIGPLEAADSALPAVAPAPVDVAPIGPPASAPGTSTGRITAYAVGGFGLVAIGVGTVAGILAVTKTSQSESRCSPRCSEEGFDLHTSAVTAADVSTVSFVTGAVALGVGVLLYFTSRPPASRTAALPWALRF